MENGILLGSINHANQGSSSNDELDPTTGGPTEELGTPTQEKQEAMNLVQKVH